MEKSEKNDENEPIKEPENTNKNIQLKKEINLNNINTNPTKEKTKRKRTKTSTKNEKIKIKKNENVNDIIKENIDEKNGIDKKNKSRIICSSCKIRCATQNKQDKSRYKTCRQCRYRKKKEYWKRVCKKKTEE